jgi:2-methylcitrate dehydratase PrpD
MEEQGNTFSCDGRGGGCENLDGGGHNATTYSEKMADFVSDLNFVDIPRDVLEKSKQLVLDTLGVALAAVDETFTKSMLDVAKSMSGPGESSVWGRSEKLPAANAALVNGTMAHGLDFDDMHRAASSHMSVVVVPTALAVAEQKKISGGKIIAAIVAGYEIGARIGLAALGKLLLRGWHPTAVFGTFSAATVAAKLMGLTPRQTVLAMGIAGSQASGLAQWIEEGSWTKRMHPGWAAHSGIIASLLARTGYDAPRKIFEGGQGLYRAFLRDGNYSLEKLTDQLGKRWETRQICIKMYPAGY